MATIDSRGVVDDGTADLTVNGTLTKGSNAMTPSSLTNTTNTLTVPSMYRYSGGTSCTSSLPSAASFPGGMCIFSPTLGSGGGMLLTGSAAVVTGIVFAAASGSIGRHANVTTQGTKLQLANSGSVVLVSDGIMWLHMTSSGSLTFLA